MQITETRDNIISTNLYLLKPSDAIKKKTLKKTCFLQKKNLASKKTLKKCFFFLSKYLFKIK